MINPRTFTNCLFEGKEAEGPYKGLKTLFVASSKIKSDDLLKIIKTEKYRVIYFGAGDTCTISKEHEKILPKLSHLKKIIEIDNINILKTLKKNTINNAEIVFTFKKEKQDIYSFNYSIFKKYKINYIKFQLPNMIIWLPNNFYLTYLNDKYFDQDKRIN
jgi:hypothetical protein